MGCDIHMMIEYVAYGEGDNKTWYDFGGRIGPGRDYAMFGVLAGVRSSREPVHPLRGLPETMSHEGEEYFAEDTDLHSKTWLTPDEYAECIAEAWLDPEVMDYGGGPGTVYQVIMAALLAFKERGAEARLLIAFDN